MAWLPVYEDLPRHPKTVELSIELGISEPLAVGHLVSLWLWAIGNASDGQLPKNPSVIERIVGWAGEPGALVAGLVKVGWVDATEEGTSIHDWHDYAGQLLDKRAKEAARKEEWRRAKQAERDVDTPGTGRGRNADGTRTSQGQDADATRTSDVNSNSNSDSNKKKKKHLSTGASPADDFDAFWTLYPRKEGKGQARRAFASAAKKIGADAVIAGLNARLGMLKSKERQFIPLPATWLNGERWTDEMVIEPGSLPEHDKRLAQLREIPPESRQFFCRQHGWGDEWKEVGDERLAG